MLVEETEKTLATFNKIRFQIFLLTNKQIKNSFKRCAISNSKMQNCHKLDFLNSTFAILNSNFFDRVG
jgi:hypothetical protein